MNNLVENAKHMLISCLDAKKGESLLVITDDTRIDIANEIYKAGCELGLESMVMLMKTRSVSGEEPPMAVCEAMKKADIVVAPTAHSITHTNARINAVKEGTRVATMPGITRDMFLQGAITADFDKVEILTSKLTEILTKSSVARIEKDGKVLTINIDGRNGVPSPGIYRLPGQSGNIPSGEAYIAPLEDGANGEITIDGSMVGIGKLNSPLHMEIKNGKLTKVTGEHSEKLDILFKNDINGIVCELGIGTNDKAILNGVILEDEKVYGTIHIAFGTNTSFGGINKADCHMDGIVLKPTLYLDDMLIIENGEFRV